MKNKKQEIIASNLTAIYCVAQIAILVLGIAFV